MIFVGSIPFRSIVFGILPYRYGNNGHLETVQYLTSYKLLPQHSTHFKRIAFIGLLLFIGFYLAQINVRKVVFIVPMDTKFIFPCIAICL